MTKHMIEGQEKSLLFAWKIRNSYKYVDIDIINDMHEGTIAGLRTVRGCTRGIYPPSFE